MEIRTFFSGAKSGINAFGIQIGRFPSRAASRVLIFLRHRFWVLGIIVLAIVLWLFLSWQLAPSDFQDRKELAQLWAQILAATGLFIGAYYAWRRIDVAQEGQITERFTRAIDQLGSEKLEIRMGGSTPSSGLPRTLRKTTGRSWGS